MLKGVMKMNLKYLFIITISFLICYLESTAQPQCSSNIQVFETCNSEYLNLEFVFLGRVISVENSVVDSPKSLTVPRKIIVNVEIPLKGNLNKHARVELFLDQRCEANVEVNGKHIFTAESVSNSKFSGLFSRKWTTDMQEYPTQEINEIINGIRKVIKKIKQPRIVGKVIQHFGNKDISFSRSSSTLANKLGYDPLYTKPLADIILVAKPITGKKFKTKTNAQGEYEFENLPSGEYEVFTNLPKEFTVTPYGDTHIMSNERKAYIKIDDGICSKKVIFATQVLGSLNGRILNVTKHWITQPIFYLTRIDPKSGRNDIFESDFYQPSGMSFSNDGTEIIADFSIEGIPIGQYILYILPSDNGFGIYYPGVNDRDKAEVIEITAGKPNNFVFRLQ
jgi:hypothetical protein